MTAYKRYKDRVYFSTDFEDGEEIFFVSFPEHPSREVEGYAWYKNKSGKHHLIHESEVQIIDCHYCEYCVCESPNSELCNCYVDDFEYFDHSVEDSKKEAEECEFFRFCKTFPKY